MNKRLFSARTSRRILSRQTLFRLASGRSVGSRDLFEFPVRKGNLRVVSFLSQSNIQNDRAVAISPEDILDGAVLQREPQVHVFQLRLRLATGFERGAPPGRFGSPEHPKYFNAVNRRPDLSVRNAISRWFRCAGGTECGGEKS